MKRYGESGKWICNICGCTYTPQTIRDMDSHHHIIWTQPQTFYRDIELYQNPKCPNCNNELELS